MNKPSKCKNCQWYGKPYWSIINPCDNCPMENVETFTHWVDPTTEELKKEIERLNNVINELEKDMKEKYHKEIDYQSKIMQSDLMQGDYPVSYYYSEQNEKLLNYYLDKLKSLKEGK